MSLTIWSMTKVRVAAVLVVALSNLIVPPMEEQRDGSLRLSLRAPISQWVIFDHYRSYEDCERNKLALVRALSSRQTNDEIDREEFAGSGSDLDEQRLLSAGIIDIKAGHCVSAVDPNGS